MASRRVISRLRSVWPTRGWLATEIGKRAALAAAVVVLVAVPLAVRVVPLGLEEGKPSPRTVRAPRAIQYVDQASTDALRTAAADAVRPVFVFDVDEQAAARREVVEFFSAVSSIRRSYSEDETRQVEVAFEQYASRVETDVVQTLLALDEASLSTVARTTESLVSGIMANRILEGDLQQARNQLAQSAQLVSLTLPERYVVIAAGEAFLRPTFVVDEQATAQARSEAAERVAPVVTYVQEGETIVSRGEIVTPIDIELVRTLGGLEQGVDREAIVAGALLMALLIIGAGVYLARYEEKTWSSVRDLVLLGALLIAMVYVTRLVSLFAPEVSPYVMPVALTPVFAALLIDARSGILMTLMTVVAAQLLGYVGGAQAISMIVTCVLAVAAVAHLSRRIELFYAGGFFMVSAGIVALGSSLASGAEVAQAVVTGAYGLAGGLLTAVLMLGLLPFLEFIFGITSDITLLELGTPSHPLLRLLMNEAPGTYSHSVLTANLAETAAEAIGASGSLARVAGYYHDVGKLARPGFFVENQAGALNPHDEIEPAQSASIITSHVTDGVALAERYRLPSEVVDIVRDHHGTSVVSYFYDKARRSGGEPSEQEFRYGGRRPRSREAALVMLADSAEAAVRALKQTSPESIEDTVRKVVRTKLDDGQLHATDLTLADVERITGVYARMLSSIYHPRIEYPAAVAKGEANAGPSEQPSGS